MAIQIQGNGGTVAEIGGTTFRGQHIHSKPLEYGALGHYRVAFRFALVNSQAGNSKLFEIRNTHATNLIIPTRLNIRWVQTAAHTAAIEDSLDVYKLTGFTVISTTNTVTPTVSVKRASMAAAPGGAAVRHVTAAGVAGGMTGGTSTKDGSPIHQLPKWLLAAVPTASEPVFSFSDVLDDVNGTHPFVLVQNEGILIENRAALGAAAGSTVYVDFSWAEVTAF